MQNPLRDDERRLLESMLDRIKRSFALSKPERRRLHDEEWAAGSERGSVLGEAEVLSDLVAGVGMTWLERGWNTEPLSALLRASAHK
jgi:hypothetical protein